MRKNQRFAPIQQVDDQTEQAHARRMPSGVSNAAGQQERGTEGRGASGAEMSLSGTFGAASTRRLWLACT